MSIEVYAFEDADGNAVDSFTTQDIEEARRYAQAGNLRLIARIFEYSDSELIEDYTSLREEDPIKTYSVTVSRTHTVHMEVEIEASDPNAAEVEALNRAEHGDYDEDFGALAVDTPCEFETHDAEEIEE